MWIVRGLLTLFFMTGLVLAAAQAEDHSAIQPAPVTLAPPLHYAAGKGKLDMIELLLGAGARPDILDKAGTMPYAKAASHRNDQVAQWLRHLATDR